MKVSKESHLIQQLFNLAVDIQPVARAKIVAALVYKNKIIAYGNNSTKTDPLQSKFSKNPKAILLHAEISCIKNAIKRYGTDILKKSTLYVIRAKQNPDGDFVYGMAKPCSGCYGAILHFGIPKVVYSTDVENQFGTLIF